MRTPIAMTAHASPRGLREHEPEGRRLAAGSLRARRLGAGRGARRDERQPVAQGSLRVHLRRHVQARALRARASRRAARASRVRRLTAASVAELQGRELTRIVLTVLVIGGLIAATFWILRPFLGAIIWATMIVVATWPVMLWVQRRLRRPALARGDGDVGHPAAGAGGAALGRDRHRRRPTSTTSSAGRRTCATTSCRRRRRGWRTCRWSARARCSSGTKSPPRASRCWR